MSVLTQLFVPGEARPLKIAPEVIYTSSYYKGVIYLWAPQSRGANQKTKREGLDRISQGPPNIYFILSLINSYPASHTLTDNSPTSRQLV